MTFLERLDSGNVLVSDGATGTYLQSHGLEPGGCPEAPFPMKLALSITCGPQRA